MKREESPEEMTESYVDRDDFMYYRQVSFGKRVKKFGPQEANSRPIVVSCKTDNPFILSKIGVTCFASLGMSVSIQA